MNLICFTAICDEDENNIVVAINVKYIKSEVSKK